MTRFVFLTMFLALLGAQAPAAVILAEDFDDEAANFGTQLNFNSYSTFQQNIGVTDLIASGGFGIDCVGNSGGCVDLDGSVAGTDPTSLLEVFFPGEVGSYEISFKLSGNQRGQAADTVTAAYFVGDAQNLGVDYTLSSGDPFQTYSLMFDVTVAGQGLFQIGQSGPSDNFGAILDDVVISFTAPMAVIPLPASVAGLGLAVLALGGLRGARRRT